MTLDIQTRIGDLVLDLPAAMRIFEALNIDYCCGGQRTLAAACAHAGSTPSGVTTMRSRSVPYSATRSSAAACDGVMMTAARSRARGTKVR